MEELKVTIDPTKSFRVIPRDTPPRKRSHRDCSHLLVGDSDRVIGIVLGLNLKTGVITKLEYDDRGDWKEVRELEVRLDDDGRIVRPYPDQIVKISNDGLVIH
jgi:hypothetical protein